MCVGICAYVHSFGKRVCNSTRFLRFVNLKVKNHQIMSLEDEERSEKYTEKIRDDFKNGESATQREKQSV